MIFWDQGRHRFPSLWCAILRPVVDAFPRPSTERHNMVGNESAAARWPFTSCSERCTLERLRLNRAETERLATKRGGGTLSAVTDGEARRARTHFWEKPSLLDRCYPAWQGRPALRLEADRPR